MVAGQLSTFVRFADDCFDLLAGWLFAGRFYLLARAPRGGASTRIVAWQRLQRSSFVPSSRKRAPVRVGLPQLVHTSITFEMEMGISFESRPPCRFFWLRRMWR